MDNCERVASHPAPELENPTVLVVEDEILVRMMMTDCLREANYRVIEASNGDQAIAILRSATKVHVVISDVRMPGSLDGVGLAKLVKSERPEVKIVLVSGHLRPLDGVENDGFFVKPYNVDGVIAHIQTLLRPGS
jgi:two-component system, response regulator PdtaR